MILVLVVFFQTRDGLVGYGATTSPMRSRVLIPGSYCFVVIVADVSTLELIAPSFRSLELAVPRFLCSPGFRPPRDAGVASMMPHVPAGVGRR